MLMAKKMMIRIQRQSHRTDRRLSGAPESSDYILNFNDKSTLIVYSVFHESENKGLVFVKFSLLYYSFRGHGKIIVLPYRRGWGGGGNWRSPRVPIITSAKIGTPV